MLRPVNISGFTPVDRISRTISAVTLPHPPIAGATGKGNLMALMGR